MARSAAKKMTIAVLTNVGRADPDKLHRLWY
jgi:hypothetical protein